MKTKDPPSRLILTLAEALRDAMGAMGGELPDDATRAQRKQWREWEALVSKALALRTWKGPVKAPRSVKPPKRGGYRVCVRTTAGGWATWKISNAQGKAENLSGPKADALMKGLKREGYEVAKFQGRKRIK